MGINQCFRCHVDKIYEAIGHTDQFNEDLISEKYAQGLETAGAKVFCKTCDRAILYIQDEYGIWNELELEQKRR